MFVIFGLSQVQLNLNDFSELNHYPYYQCEYFYRMVRPPLVFNLFFIVLIVRNDVMRKAVARRWNALLEK